MKEQMKKDKETAPGSSPAEPGSPDVQDVTAILLADDADSSDRHPGGRPTVYDDTMPYRVFLAVPYGATWSAIAEACGVSVSTVKVWADPKEGERYHAEFQAACARAHEVCDDRVVTSCFRRATGYVITQQAMDKQGNIKELEITVPSDPNSFAFWLKNRRPKEWADKQQLELSGGITVEQLTDDDLDAELVLVEAALEAAEAGTGAREASSSAAGSQLSTAPAGGARSNRGDAG